MKRILALALLAGAFFAPVSYADVTQHPVNCAPGVPCPADAGSGTGDDAAIGFGKINTDIGALTTAVNAAATAPVTDAESALLVKPSAFLVSTSNIASLSGLPTIDSVTMTRAGVVLLTAQTTPSQNGFWCVPASGAWARCPFYSSGSTTQAVIDETTLIRGGTAYSGTTWRLSAPTTGGIIIDTTSTTWTQVTLGSSAGGGSGLPAGTGIVEVASGVGSVVAAPAGAVVGTTDTQTITGKSIDASEVNTGTLSSAQVPQIALGSTGNGGVGGTLPFADMPPCPTGDVYGNYSGITAVASCNAATAITGTGTTSQVLVGGTTPAFGSINLATMPGASILPKANGGWGTATPILYQSAIPFIFPSSGSMGNNGAITGLTALPTTYARAFIYMKTGAIATASTAGWYPLVGSSSTAGTVYNNIYTGGQPVWPGSLTAFATTGPGAWTSTTGSFITGPTFTIPANSLGVNGCLALNGVTVNNATGNAKQLQLQLASGNAENLVFSAAVGSITVGLGHLTCNRSLANSQVGNAISNGGVSSSGNAPVYNAIDTTSNVTVNIGFQLATATDFLVLEYLAAPEYAN